MEKSKATTPLVEVKGAIELSAIEVEPRVCGPCTLKIQHHDWLEDELSAWRMLSSSSTLLD